MHKLKNHFLIINIIALSVNQVILASEKTSTDLPAISFVNNTMPAPASLTTVMQLAALSVYLGLRVKNEPEVVIPSPKIAPETIVILLDKKPKIKKPNNSKRSLYLPKPKNHKHDPRLASARHNFNTK
jgi:hypothetical protein